MTDEDYLENLLPVAAHPCPVTDTGSSGAGHCHHDRGFAQPRRTCFGHCFGRRAGIDWDQVEAQDIILLYPGVSHLEWVDGRYLRIGRDRHGGGWAFPQRRNLLCLPFRRNRTHGRSHRDRRQARTEPDSGQGGVDPGTGAGRQ
jgi:hypothetical protein